MKKWLFLLLALVCSPALAQAAPPLPAPLAPYAETITLLLGLLSAGLVYPLTAIAKHFGRTSGPTTVTISAVLALLVSAGGALYQAAQGHTGASLGAALVNALIAFLAANGAYIGLVAASAKGAAKVASALPTPDPMAGYAPATWADVQATAGRDEPISQVQP